MTNEFPRLLSLLRKERGLTQKSAAQQLGVSQALLSHYEKGIRECGLDFLVRAADFYGVTTDYLLGRSSDRGAEPSPESLQSPAQGQEKVFRGSVIASLGKVLTCNSVSLLFDLLKEFDYREYSDYAHQYLSLSVYKLFRYFYSANPSNPQDFFSLPPEEFSESVSAAMLLCELKLKGYSSQVNRELRADNVEKKQTVSYEMLTKSYPQLASSLLNVLKSAEALSKPLLDGEKQ